MGLLDKMKYIPSMNELQGGLGEILTKFVSYIDIPEVLVLHDILIDGYENNTSQIDLILIGEKGIYVAEVKLYTDAHIYGDGRKKQWYYYKGGKKYDIYSPIMQNKNHIKYLKTFLKEFGDIPCFSVIVLLCEDFKINNINNDINNPDTVILSGLPQLRKGMEMIAKGKESVLSEETKQQIFNYIKNHQYIGKEKRIEHKEKVILIKEKIDNIQNSNICPHCKSPLVLRKGKYGEFYGCSNYPKCKYIKK